MDRDELRDRTKAFAVRIIKLSRALPRDVAAQTLARQLVRSGTSVGANYREALRASSRKHFLSIMQTTLREADETLYWLELLADSTMIDHNRLSDLMQECNELVAIFSATVRTTKTTPVPDQSRAAEESPKSPSHDP